MHSSKFSLELSVDCSNSVVAEIPSSCARIIEAKAECSDKTDAQF